MAVGDTMFESKGGALNVSLTAAVSKGQVAIVEGWLGIASNDGVSGEIVALDVDQYEYQFVFPSGFSANKGDIVYVTIASVTGHTPQDAAYTTSAGAGKVALCKLTSALTTVGSTKVATGRLLPQFAS